MKKIKQSKYITDTSKYIFIPDAVYCKDGSVNFVGRSGYVWSSSLDASRPDYAWYLNFSLGGCDMSSSNRCRGQFVRAVRK